MHIFFINYITFFLNCTVVVLNVKLLKYSVRKTCSGCVGVHLHKIAHLKKKKGCWSIMMKSFVLQGHRALLIQLRC